MLRSNALPHARRPPVMSQLRDGRKHDCLEQRAVAVGQGQHDEGYRKVPGLAESKGGDLADVKDEGGSGVATCSVHRKRQTVASSRILTQAAKHQLLCLQH